MTSCRDLASAYTPGSFLGDTVKSKTVPRIAFRSLLNLLREAVLQRALQAGHGPADQTRHERMIASNGRTAPEIQPRRCSGDMLYRSVILQHNMCGRQLTCGVRCRPQEADQKDRCKESLGHPEPASGVNRCLRRRTNVSSFSVQGRDRR